MKTLILFAYNERLSIFDDNLRFFIEFGVFESDLYDFCIVVSGPVQQLPTKKVKNMQILERNNEKGDFGAWGDGLKLYNLDSYDKFIFLNDTSRGPYVQGTCPVEMWPQLFTCMLDDRCKLVGPTQNSMIEEHIQSYAFACDITALKILMDDRIFAPTLQYPLQKNQFIIRHEIGMSRLLISKGFTFKSFFKGNGLTPYFGLITISPFEIMFIKANMPMKFDKRQIENATPGWNSVHRPCLSTKKTNEKVLIVSRRSLQKK